MKTTLETSEDENYTRNEWRWKLHSKRVKLGGSKLEMFVLYVIKNGTSKSMGDEKYTQNERNDWDYQF